MSNFKPIKKLTSDSGDVLKSRMSVVSLAQARDITSFREPVRLHGIWYELPKEMRQIRALKAETFGPSLLPHMYILDIDQDSASQEIDFRWRLFGSIHSARYGEATGGYLSEAATKHSGAASSYQIAQWVYEQKQDAFYMNHYSDDVGPVRSTSTVAMPVLSESGDVTHVLGCSVWQSLRPDS